jgi:hypothetical protein
MEQYRDTIAALVAAILKETKEPAVRSVPIHLLDQVYTADAGSDDSLEDLLDFISNTSEGAITVSRKGGTPAVQVLDKVTLYLMLYSLNFNLATVDLLHWQDFEKLVQHALAENGYITKKNFRFTDSKGNKHEIDVVAADRQSKDHILLLIDAKHWDYRANASVTKIVEAANEQFNRATELGDDLPVLADLLFDMKLKWTSCMILPMVVTLLNPPLQNFFIPIVSILSFNGFVQEFSDNIDQYKKRIVTGIPIQQRLND